MSDESTKKKVHQGELLPPEGANLPAVPDMPQGSPFGISLFARAKFEAQARAFRAHAGLRRAQRESAAAETELYGAAQDRLAAKENLARAVTRHRHLDKILDADEAKLLQELNGVFDGIAAEKTAAQERAEDRVLERRVQLAQLEAQAVEAEARLELIKNPPAAPTLQPREDPNAGLTRAQRITRAISRVRVDGAELKEAVVEGAGGEDRLTPEDQEQLRLIDLWIKDQIRQTMESL